MPIREDQSVLIRTLTRRCFLSALAGACSPLLPLGLFAAASPVFMLSGQVANASGKYPVYVALWDADTFLRKPVRQIRIDPPAAPRFQFHVPAGRWALSAFEDRNANGVLDMGFFGPREPSGFWRPFHQWRKPRFDDVAAQIDRDTPDAEISLGK